VKVPHLLATSPWLAGALLAIGGGSHLPAPAPDAAPAAATAAPQFIQAHLDIRPGICPNTLNVSGLDAPDPDDPNAAVSTLSMGVLGNKLNVTQIALGSLTLSRPSADDFRVVTPYEMGFADIATPFIGPECGCHTLGADGNLDLKLVFLKQEVVDTLALAGVPTGTQVPLIVRGLLVTGDEFEAVDCVRIVH
jgi:hypothetical protein